MPFTDQPHKDTYAKIDGKIFYIIDRSYKTQGRQGGLMIMKLRNMETGNNSTVTIKAGMKVEVIEPETKEVQYLYCDSASGYFMDTTTFETVTINLPVIEDYIPYLKEGEKTLIIIYEDKVLSVRRKPSVTLKVTESSDAVKGNTANSATKVVTVETGAKVNVPLFVKLGDMIIINTESGQYTGREN